jgi:hypothetical protein
MNVDASSVPSEKQPLAPQIVVWLIVSWLWVGIPLGLGVYRTVLNAKALFDAPAAAAPVVPAATK